MWKPSKIVLRKRSGRVILNASSKSSEILHIEPKKKGK